jgi:hypothetical protein
LGTGDFWPSGQDDLHRLSRDEILDTFLYLEAKKRLARDLSRAGYPVTIGGPHTIGNGITGRELEKSSAPLEDAGGGSFRKKARELRSDPDSPEDTSNEILFHVHGVTAGLVVGTYAYKAWAGNGAPLAELSHAETMGLALCFVLSVSYAISLIRNVIVKRRSR